MTSKKRPKALDYVRSIAISLKRLELQRNRDLLTSYVFRGFRDWNSSSWIALREEESKLLKELSELEP